jgi:hypothetical protein
MPPYPFAICVASAVSDPRSVSLATGEAARAAQVALIQAYRKSRGLTQTEVISLKKALERLRIAAASELRLMYQREG